MAMLNNQRVTLKYGDFRIFLGDWLPLNIIWTYGIKMICLIDIEIGEL